MSEEIEIMQQLLGSTAAAATHLDQQIVIYEHKITAMRRLVLAALVILMMQVVAIAALCVFALVS